MRVFRMFPYHVRLAIVSLRQDRGLTIAMFVCLMLGGGLWTTTVTHYLREYPAARPLSPSLHQIEIGHPHALALFAGPGANQPAWHSRTRVTYPEYKLLASSGLAARQTGTFRSSLLVATPDDPIARLADVRFVGADFFSLFQIPLGRGHAFSRAEEEARVPAVVIGQRMSRTLFGDQDSVGRQVIIEGRRFRIVGTTGADQPYRPDWDIFWGGKTQDAFYLPITWAQPLKAWPGRMAVQSVIPNADAVWSSDGVFVSFWIELTSASHRAAYAAFLRQHFGDTGPAYHLRALAEWRREFVLPPTDILYLSILFSAGLAAAAFTTARLLLARGMARREQLGIHRALGATRAMLFLRQMIEAALVALPAALAALVLCQLQHSFYNHVALEMDNPVRLTWLPAAIGGLTTFAIGLLAAAYPAWRLARVVPTVYLGRP